MLHHPHTRTAILAAVAALVLATLAMCGGVSPRQPAAAFAAIVRD